MADETVVVLTSDHGDLVGAHGGLVQKWFNAFDEAVRVPFVAAGPGIPAGGPGVSVPTSHVDLVPTLLGLAGIDPEQAAAGVSSHHDEVHPLPGRDLSGLVRGEVDEAAFDSPIYFMTEDNVTSGADQVNILNGTPFDAITGATSIESVVASLPTGDAGGPRALEGQPLLRAPRRLVRGARRRAEPVPGAGRRAAPRAAQPDPRPRGAPEPGRLRPSTLSRMLSVLEDQRETKRLLPTLRNPA